jgi:hypothetical protein
MEIRRGADRDVPVLLGLFDEARTRGVSLVRVDFYAGGTGDLVRYYTRQGFTPTGTFTVGTWPGQVFEQRI